MAEGRGRYRFATLRPITFIHAARVYPVIASVSFRDRHNHEWMRLTTRTQTIAKDYWWNGNSGFKRGLTLAGREFWTGTPDFRWSITPTLKHDPDFQFHHCDGFPFGLETTNRHYLSLGLQSATGWRDRLLVHTYYRALCAFSSIAWRSGPDDGIHSVNLLHPNEDDF